MSTPSGGTLTTSTINSEDHCVDIRLTSHAVPKGNGDSRIRETNLGTNQLCHYTPHICMQHLRIFVTTQICQFHTSILIGTVNQSKLMYKIGISLL